METATTQAAETQFSLLVLKKNKKKTGQNWFVSFTAPSENRKARGVAVHAGGPSFLDTVLFVHGDRVLLCFYSPAVQMRQSIIKLGDDREEVIWVELVGSQEAGCCLPVVCYLWSARYDCACLQHRFYGERRMWKSYAFFLLYSMVGSCLDFHPVLVPNPATMQRRCPTRHNTKFRGFFIA